MRKLLVLVVLFSSSIASAGEIKSRYFLEETAVGKKQPNKVKKNYSFPQERKIEIIGRVNNCAIVRTGRGKVIVVKLDSGGER